MTLFSDGMEMLYDTLAEDLGEYREATTANNEAADEDLVGVFVKIYGPNQSDAVHGNRDQFGEDAPQQARYRLPAGTSLQKTGRILVNGQTWNIDEITTDEQSRVVVSLILPNAKKLSRLNNKR